MHDSSYRPHGVSFVCGRDMVATDLHAHHNLVRLADYHGSKSGNCFGKRKGGTSMQDAKRLACAVIYRHGGFDAFFRGIGV